jgi:SAM-dependent methyltransferase
MKSRKTLGKADQDFTVRQASAWATYREMGLHSGAPTVNGPGSFLESTEEVRRWLPEVIRQRGVTSVVDVPCGDWHWMQYVDLVGADYLGLDVVPDTIQQNQVRFAARSDVQFICWNALCDPFPWQPDLIFCRDFLQHLPNDQIQAVLDKFIASGGRYLITNNYIGADNYAVECKVDSGHAGAYDLTEPLPGYYYRPVNIEAPPFSLAGRLEAIIEGAGDEDYNEINQELVLYDLTVPKS